MAKPSALGKGLSALISTRPATPLASPAPATEKGERVQQLAPTLLTPSPLQPRKVFKEDELRELADSIREHGVLQPLICRKSGDVFELIAGERRWRASQLVGIEKLPVIVREASDRDVLELALIENLQRAELNPLEEAKAYLRLVEEFSLKQEDISRSVGRSRAAVANSIRLLDLAPELQTWLSQERLSVGHAKVLLSLRSHEEQVAAAEEILRKGLTVRGTETLVAQIADAKGKEKRTKSPKANARLAPAIQRLQNRLQHHFGTHVALQHNEKRGRIEIEYYGKEDLERILALLGLAADER